MSEAGQSQPYRSQSRSQSRSHQSHHRCHHHPANTQQLTVGRLVGGAQVPGVLLWQAVHFEGLRGKRLHMLEIQKHMHLPSSNTLASENPYYTHQTALCRKGSTQHNSHHHHHHRRYHHRHHPTKTTRNTAGRQASKQAGTQAKHVSHLARQSVSVFLKHFCWMTLV